MDNQATPTPVVESTTQAVLVVQPAPPSSENLADMNFLFGVILSVCLPVYLLKLAIRQLNFDHD